MVARPPANVEWCSEPQVQVETGSNTALQGNLVIGFEDKVVSLFERIKGAADQQKSSFIPLEPGRQATGRVPGVTGLTLTVPFSHAGNILSASFHSTAGLLTTSHDDTARLWFVRPDTRPVEDLALLGQTLSGLRLSDEGNPVPLTQEEWRD